MARVGLRVMTMKGYYTLYIALELKPHHQMHFSVKFGPLFSGRRSYPSAGYTDDIF